MHSLEDQHGLPSTHQLQSRVHMLQPQGQQKHALCHSSPSCTSAARVKHSACALYAQSMGIAIRWAMRPIVEYLNWMIMTSALSTVTRVAVVSRKAGKTRTAKRCTNPSASDSDDHERSTFSTEGSKSFCQTKSQRQADQPRPRQQTQIYKPTDLVL